MEIMAFLIGAAARLNPSSDEATVAWPNEAKTVGAVKAANTTNEPKSWPSHWAVTKYL